MNSDLLSRCFQENGVENTFILASTFRSGSTYIAALMRANGLPGLGKERFNDAHQHVGDAPNEFTKYINEIIESFLRVDLKKEDHAKILNDTFCTKIMWPHLRQLALCCDFPRQESRSYIEAFPSSKWLLVTRRDKVRQAISFWRAKTSNRWHVYKNEPEPAIEFDFDAIRQCLEEQIMHDILWEDFLIESGADFMRVEYEDFRANTRSMIKAIFRFFGVAIYDKDIFVKVPLRQQSDHLTEEFYEKYMEKYYL